MNLRKKQYDEMLLLEGVYKDFSDPGDPLNPFSPYIPTVIENEVDDHSDIVSFHGDSSNMDSTDKDVTNFKSVG